MSEPSVTREDVVKALERLRTLQEYRGYIDGKAAELYQADLSIVTDRLATLERESKERGERIVALEAGLFSAGRLYGFECPDGLPCWCEPDERSGPHSQQCADLRALLCDPTDEVGDAIDAYDEELERLHGIVATLEREREALRPLAEAAVQWAAADAAAGDDEEANIVADIAEGTLLDAATAYAAALTPAAPTGGAA